MRALRVILILSFLLGATNAASAELRKPRKAEAARLLREGNAQYELRNFEGAIELYKKGATIEKAAVFWYNLGQAYRQLEKYPDAVWYYERLLAERGVGEPHRSVVEKLISDMQLEIVKVQPTGPEGGTVAPATTPVAPPIVPPRDEDEEKEEVVPPRDDLVSDETRHWYSDRIAWLCVVPGLAAITGGAVLLFQATDLDDRAAIEPSRRDELESMATGYRVIGGTLLAGGAVAVSWGVYRFIVHGKTRRDPHSVAVTPWIPNPSTHGVALSLPF